jgi:hypothetical protein
MLTGIGCICCLLFLVFVYPLYWLLRRYIDNNNNIIIIIIIVGISFMRGIYTYIPETKHVPGGHCVATILM